MITPILGVITGKPKCDPGILLYEDQSDNMYILDILPTSPFKSTELRPGMLVVSVNNIPCEEVTIEFIEIILLEAQGKVNILAHHDSTTMEPMGDIITTTPRHTKDRNVIVTDSDVEESSIGSDVEESSIGSDVEEKLIASDVESLMQPLRYLPTVVQHQQSKAARPHPPGVQEGGAWGKVNVVGLRSRLLVAARCCFIGPMWCLILCCAIDQAKAYCVDGNVSHNDASVCRNFHFLR